MRKILAAMLAIAMVFVVGAGVLGIDGALGGTMAVQAVSSDGEVGSDGDIGSDGDQKQEEPATVVKKANPITVTGKTANLKYTALKKAKKTIKISNLLTVKNAKGTKTYSISKVNKSKSYFSINKSTGLLTVKKGLKKGTYKVTIKVTAKGNKTYKSKSVSKVAKVVVK